MQDKDRYSAIQILRYLAGAYHKQLQSFDKLEVVLPVLFYHGDEEWEFQALEELIPSYPDNLKQYIPIQTTNFINLQNISDDHIQSLRNAFLATTMLMQKHSHNQQYLHNEINRIFQSLPVKGVGNLNTAIFFISYFS